MRKHGPAAPASPETPPPSQSSAPPSSQEPAPVEPPPEEEPELSPPETGFARYINDPTLTNNLSISGSQATMYSSVTADSSVTKIVITQVLQKDGKDVSGTSKSQTFNKNSASKQDTVTCSGSGTFRVKTTYKITSPDGTDTHTKYSNTVNK